MTKAKALFSKYSEERSRSRGAIFGASAGLGAGAALGMVVGLGVGKAIGLKGKGLTSLVLHRAGTSGVKMGIGGAAVGTIIGRKKKRPIRSDK